MDDQGDTIGVHVHSLERTDHGYEPERLDLAAGGTWVITAHDRDNRTIEEFQRRLETSRRVGALDGGSFVAFLLDWLFTAYMATIGAIDREIDDLDVSILHSSGDGPSLERIADLRRRVARIRRALSGTPRTGELASSHRVQRRDDRERPAPLRGGGGSASSRR